MGEFSLRVRNDPADDYAQRKIRTQVVIWLPLSSCVKSFASITKFTNELFEILNAGNGAWPVG